jgi:hypothetical protein
MTRLDRKSRAFLSAWIANFGTEPRSKFANLERRSFSLLEFLAFPVRDIRGIRLLGDGERRHC